MFLKVNHSYAKRETTARNLRPLSPVPFELVKLLRDCMLYSAGILFDELLFGGGSGVLFNELRKPAEKAISYLKPIILWKLETKIQNNSKIVQFKSSFQVMLPCT